MKAPRHPVLRPVLIPALIVHGGAGGRGPARELPERRAGLIAAAEAGAAILRGGGLALDAAIAAVVVLENHPLFNAGYGSMLNADGIVEMDAGMEVAHARRSEAPAGFGTGAVAAVRRVRNPILLARAVMEHTRHVLMVGEHAERVASAAAIPLVDGRELITPRALERWRAWSGSRAAAGGRVHGTVGAAAVDSRGALAAATSTGGYPRKLAGRVGDSAILGAGFFASEAGAASTTGLGEVIIKLGLCRRAVMDLSRVSPKVAAARAIAAISRIPDADAGIIVIDRKGRFGYAHNAEQMEIAMFDPTAGVRHELLKPQKPAR
jgi:beta-aspartyl-peptidase (threonine type)